MAPRLTAETFCFAPAQTLASPSTVSVRWSSAVSTPPSSWRATYETNLALEPSNGTYRRTLTIGIPIRVGRTSPPYTPIHHPYIATCGKVW